MIQEEVSPLAAAPAPVSMGIERMYQIYEKLNSAENKVAVSGVT